MPADDATFGRAGLPTASGGDGLILKVATWQQRGDTARVVGFIRGTEQSTLADVKALRDQMQGYDLNPDEPVIPVTCEADTSRDGWYSVESVEVSSDVAGRMRSNADEKEIVYRWEADLTRVPDWQAPMFEVLSSGANRVNSHSVTGQRPWVGLPDTDALGINIASYSVVTVDGAQQTVRQIYTTTSTLYDGSTSIYVPASEAYHVAASIRHGARVASSSAPVVTSHRSVVGRQGDIDATGVLLDNDLIRVLYGPNAGELIVGQWQEASAAWKYKSWLLTHGGASAGSLGDPVSAVVLRNSPECVTVRFVYSLSFVGVTADITLRRGATWVEGLTQVVGSADTRQFGLYSYTGENGVIAGVTGGMDAAADDADSNKYRIRTPKAFTNVNADGGIYATSNAASFPWAISTDFFGSDPNINSGYWAAMNHRQAIVAR